MNKRNELELYGDCIRLAYAAASGTALFDHLAEAVQRYVGTDTASIFYLHPKQLVTGGGAFGWQESDREAYFPYWAERDALINGLLAMPPMLVATNTELASLSPVEKTEVYEGFYEPCDAIHFAGCRFNIGSGWLSMVSALNSRRSGAVNAEQVARIRNIAPHLRDALRIGTQLRSLTAAAKAAEQFLSACHGAVIVCEQNGRIIGTNPSADWVLQEFSEFIRCPNDRLVLNDHIANQQLQQLLRNPSHDLAHRRPAVWLRNADASRGLECVVVAIEMPIGADRAGENTLRAVILQCQRGHAIIDQFFLQQRFAITRSEADVLAMLMQGYSLDTIATQRHSTIQTIRSYLKSLRQKLDCHTQAQLVACGWQSMPLLNRA